MITSGIIAMAGVRRGRIAPTAPGATNLFPADSEAFDNTGVWTRSNLTGVTANAAVAPDGATTAEKMIPNGTTSASHQIYTTSVNFVSGTQYTIYVHAKAAGYDKLRIAVFNSAFTANYTESIYNLNDGTLGASIAGTPSITAAANGYYICASTFTATGTDTGYVYILVAAPDGNKDTSYAGDGTSGILLWGFQQNVGTIASYQKTPV